MLTRHPAFHRGLAALAALALGAATIGAAQAAGSAHLPVL